MMRREEQLGWGSDQGHGRPGKDWTSYPCGSGMAEDLQIEGKQDKSGSATPVGSER
jgi:hypothetical protein